MLNPSLPLLLAKTIGIFFLCWWVGATFFRGKRLENEVVRWAIQLAVGSAVFNLTSIWVSLLGAQGKYGLIFVSLILGWGVFSEFKKKKPKKPAVQPSRLSLFLVISFIGVISYLLPFVIKGTSGYYARGGGDHN